MSATRRMPDDEFQARVTALAKEAALKHYQRKNHGASEAAGVQFAERHWHQFINVAADILALWEVLDENEASPNN